MTRTQPDGYLSLPPSGKGNPVLVLHAWWGLNETIRAYCNRLTASGFTVFAPDLYHGQVADKIADAEALVKALNANYLQARVEISDAALFLNENLGQAGSGLAVIGFSLGAYYALELSVSDPGLVRRVVVYYGTGVEDFNGARADYLGHFAENDAYEPESNVETLEKVLKKAGCSAKMYRYPETGHWFAEPDRTQAYNQSAAELAWDRTLEFLKPSFRV